MVRRAAKTSASRSLLVAAFTTAAAVALASNAFAVAVAPGTAPRAQLRKSRSSAHRGLLMCKAALQEPEARCLTWRVPAPTTYRQRENVDRLLAAYRESDIVELFNQAGFETTVVDSTKWPQFVACLVDGVEKNELKDKIRKWQFATKSDSAEVLVDAAVCGSKIQVTLRAFENDGDEVVYKEATIEKELKVVKKSAKPDVLDRVLLGVCSFGASELVWADKQQKRDREENSLIDLTRDEIVVKNLLATYLGPALKSSGILVVMS